MTRTLPRDPHTDPPNALPPIWSTLPRELQLRAISLLVQLAYTQVTQPKQLFSQEHDHGQSTQ